MTSNLLLFGWNRSIPGREGASAEHFQEFVKYLGELKASGRIDSSEVVFLDTHGGDLNGFVLIRAASAKLDAVVSSPECIRHVARAALHLEGSGAVRGATGESIDARMAMWTELIRR